MAIAGRSPAIQADRARRAACQTPMRIQSIGPGHPWQNRRGASVRVSDCKPGRFAARTVISAALIACLTMPVIAADFLRKAPVRPANVADRCAKVEPPKGTPQVPGGDIFGFTNPTDIGDPCHWYFASENSGVAGKRDSSYLALSTKSEISYTASENLAYAFSVFTAYHKWSKVTVFQIEFVYS